MLDIDGFVSETNATNVFMVKRGIIYTPCADACLPGRFDRRMFPHFFIGITRQTIIDLVSRLPDFPPVVEKRISLVEFHTADEVFTTGTMGELTPVKEIDGRTIGNGDRPVTKHLQQIYFELTQNEGVPIPN
jgi:branched-subunit amino acid aminotransferase/4-amino-4-deoxychorismate lyase